ncbi:MAG TPA: menaquinone-dependent protoporphyrinogen IX dehydrogenase [Candidatus Acidoferrales bacterium]
MIDINRPVKRLVFSVPMARVLILYATTEGHTARVAERIAKRLRDKGHRVESQRADASATSLDLERYETVIVGAPVHYGRHPGHLRSLLRKHCAALAARPGAFFSVSLSAGGPGAKPRAARRYVETFLRQVGWQPRLTEAFGGALQYSRYGAFKRLLVLAFVGLAGGDTDTSRDYEYTDWEAVDRFADRATGDRFDLGQTPRDART